MRYFAITLFVCALAFSASFNAPAYSQRHTGYCDQAYSTADALECVNKHNLDTQEKLSDAFKFILQGQDESVKAALSEAQKNWIIYRDAQCFWESELSETPSLKRVYELSCLTDMTERRLKLLQAVQMREEEKEPREFGVQPRWMNALAHDYPHIFWRYGEWKSVDLNCDEEKEQIMTGISVARIQDAVKINKDDLVEDNHNEVSVVIAVSSNPPTGRPKAKLFNLPVVNKKEMEQPHVCRPAVHLEQIQRQATVSGEEGVNADGANGDAGAFCETALAVSDGLCGSYLIYWDGKGFSINKNSPEGNSL